MTAGRMARRIAVLLCVLLVGVLTGGGRALADPSRPPGPPTIPAPPPSGSVCASKNSGQTAWCMDWAVHTATPPAGAPSHWLTTCGSVGVPLRDACEAASLTLTSPAPNNTPSVLLDGPPGAAGNAALVGCDLFTGKANADPKQATAWAAKHDRCVQMTPQYLAALYVPAPPTGTDGGDCDTLDIACKVAKEVAKALAAGVNAGIQGFVDLVVQAMVVMLSKLAKLVFSATAIASPDTAFYTVYNSIAGVLILLVFIFFLISTIINGLRVSGPGPLSSIGGLVRAIIGITFAGGIAFVIVRAWDVATNALIDHNSRTPWDPSVWVKAITGLSGGAGTSFLALCIAGMSIIGLILLFIMMLFRGLLTTGAALFGAMAMTGQVMPETRHWGRRWFWTVNALGSSKFFIAALWIYGSRAAVESDSLLTSLKALLLIWVMVLTPGIMLRLTTMWDGYLSDVNARGVLSATGTAGDIGSGLGSGFGERLQQGSSGGDSPAADAAGQMNASASSIATTPGRAAGLDDGPARDAAQAVQTADDGDDVGDVSEAADGADQGDGSGEQGADDAGRPNAEEADAVQAGTDSARHDAASGQLTTPGDATGAAGKLPATGQGPGGGAGDDASPAAGDTPGEGSTDTVAAATTDSGAHPGGAADPRGGSADANTPAPDDGGDGAPRQGGGEPGPGGGSGADAAGGSGGAASGAGDAAIVAAI